jgi:hypothetical protein
MIKFEFDYEANAAQGGIEVPLNIKVDEELLPRFDGITFYIGRFNYWATRSLGKAKTKDLGALALNLSIPSQDDLVRLGWKGSFEPATQPPSINLYVLKHLEAVGELTGDHDSREADFNHEVNKTLVHEVQHWADFIKSGPFNSRDGEHSVEGITNLQQEIDKKQRFELAASIGELAGGYLSPKSRAEYLAQPHEVRARKAVERFTLNKAPIISCQLTPQGV